MWERSGWHRQRLVEPYLRRRDTIDASRHWQAFSRATLTTLRRLLGIVRASWNRPALAALGFPFKWAKTCSGFVVEWGRLRDSLFLFQAWSFPAPSGVADPLVHGGLHVWADYMVRLLVCTGEAGLWGECAILGSTISRATVLISMAPSRSQL